MGMGGRSRSSSAQTTTTTTDTQEVGIQQEDSVTAFDGGSVTIHETDAGAVGDAFDFAAGQSSQQTDFLAGAFEGVLDTFDTQVQAQGELGEGILGLAQSGQSAMASLAQSVAHDEAVEQSPSVGMLGMGKYLAIAAVAVVVIFMMRGKK